MNWFINPPYYKLPDDILDVKSKVRHKVVLTKSHTMTNKNLYKLLEKLWIDPLELDIIYNDLMIGQYKFTTGKKFTLIQLWEIHPSINAIL